MCANFAGPSNNRTFDPTALPPRWLDCPRKSAIIADKFIAFKTPLDDRYKEKIPVASKWTCGMLIKAVQTDQKTLGLVIDLTNTDRFYKSDVEFRDKNIDYEKIRCRGHGETPGDEQIERFIQVCNQYSNTNPDHIIGVHCTHGFNRTGFLICAYLCREHDMSIDAAIDLFAKARPTGIYKQDYLNELVKKYGDESSVLIPAPPRAEWCLTNSDDEDEANEQPVRTGGSKRPHDNSPFALPSRRPRAETSNPSPQFAVSLPGVKPVLEKPMMTALQLKCQRMCEWNRAGFPGSQPVSMDISNYNIIVQSPYRVSWKADGTRYMMLIEDKHKIYMFDRDNSVFEISHLEFPRDADYTRHLTDTLVDGELVIDKVNGMDVPRFLIYDIIMYQNENVGKRPFPERLDIIRRSIIGVRNDAISKNLINRSLDPFSVRNKDFWELSTVQKLIGPKFREQIAHEVDGLIFQPEEDPYVSGRSVRVLKWKEDNTIDFLLRISMERAKPGELPKRQACLFVNGLTRPFAYMRCTANLRQYDGKIIECSFRDHEWHFHRERTDKSFPNAKETAFGAVQAMKNPITKEILCSLIDHHLKQNVH